MLRSFAMVCGMATLCVASVGCWSGSEREVVAYVALDREFSEPILKSFEKETGIRVLAVYDVESTKTVGLVNRIIQERQRPRCDVFWNNEILHTLRLQKLNMLDTIDAAALSEWPTEYRSPDGKWVGFAARARVLLVNTDLVSADQRPDSLDDLVDPRWKGQVGIAKPLFGTTASHAAVLFATRGDEQAKRFFEQLKENAQVLSGNKQVATAVGRGQLAFGLTDTDDAMIEKTQGRPVEIIFPDQAGSGTLFIPNSACLIRGSRNSAHGQRLIRYLLSADVESELAKGRSAQFPVNPKVTEKSGVAPSDKIRWQSVDFAEAAESWETAAAFLRDLFAS